MQRHSGKHEVALGRMLMEGAAHRLRWANTFGQRLSHVAQRISRTTGNDEFAFRQQRSGLAPFCKVEESVNSYQKEKPVRFFKSLFQASNCIDRIIRGFNCVVS